MVYGVFGNMGYIENIENTGFDVILGHRVYIEHVSIWLYTVYTMEYKGHIGHIAIYRAYKGI
jgi:hypothetical protein